MREKILSETLLHGRGGVHERKKCCSMVQAGCLKTKSNERVETGCAEEGSETHLFLKSPGTRRCKDDLLNNERSHINEETGLNAYNIKCKWETQTKK